MLIEYTPKRMEDLTQFFDDLDYALLVYDNKQDRFSFFETSRASERWEASSLQVNLFCIPSEQSALPICT